jgi:hypothetical protein
MKSTIAKIFPRYTVLRIISSLVGAVIVGICVGFFYNVDSYYNNILSALIGSIIMEIELFFILCFSWVLVGQSSKIEVATVIVGAQQIDNQNFKKKILYVIKIIFGLFFIFKFLILLLALNYFLNAIKMDPLLMFSGALVAIVFFVFHICLNFKTRIHGK